MFNKDKAREYLGEDLMNCLKENNYEKAKRIIQIDSKAINYLNDDKKTALDIAAEDKDIERYNFIEENGGRPGAEVAVKKEKDEAFLQKLKELEKQAWDNVIEGWEI